MVSGLLIFGRPLAKWVGWQAMATAPATIPSVSATSRRRRAPRHWIPRLELAPRRLGLALLVIVVGTGLGAVPLWKELPLMVGSRHVASRRNAFV